MIDRSLRGYASYSQFRFEDISSKQIEAMANVDVTLNRDAVPEAFRLHADVLVDRLDLARGMRADHLCKFAPGFFVYAPSGRESELALAYGYLISALYRKRMPSATISTREIFDFIKPGNDWSYGGSSELLDHLSAVPLLILHDLGTEPLFAAGTDLEAHYLNLRRLADERHNNGLPSVVHIAQALNYFLEMNALDGSDVMGLSRFAWAMSEFGSGGEEANHQARILTLDGLELVPY